MPGPRFRAWQAARRKMVTGIAALAAMAMAACKDSVVPNFTAPTAVAATPTGIQNGFAGVLNTSRNDVVGYIQFMYAFARDATQFQATESAFDSELLGQVPIAPNDFIGVSVWDNQFRNAKTLNDLIARLPSVAPPYSPGEIATLTGVARTLKALNFMWVAETHDTLGVPIAGITQPANKPAPILCNKDVWAYIVALLDSGGANLAAGGSTPIPVTLPPGFGFVSSSAATFQALNRALAGKAGLELAYAISRPADSTSVGVTDPAAQAALVRADSAILSSALYAPAALIPGGVNEPNAVYHDFSSASGDQSNPIAASATTLYYLVNFGPDYDTTDLRVKAKLVPNPATNGQPAYASLTLTPPSTYGAYSSVNSEIPIIRNEELVLLRAQIHIAQQDWATAVGLLNAVRTTVGGELPYPGSLTGYLPVREALLHEQRLSTTYENGGDRLLSIRFYRLIQSRLTDFPNDLHPTVLPIPQGELDAHNGNVTPVCP
jgi:hypothetical protein